MASPSKINANSLLSVKEIVQKPLNYERYVDLENELNQENLVAFIVNGANQYRESLKAKVRIYQKTPYAH